MVSIRDFFVFERWSSGHYLNVLLLLRRLLVEAMEYSRSLSTEGDVAYNSSLFSSVDLHQPTNIVIACSSQRGIYKPARLYYSTITSSIIAFAVSGIMHEWVVYLGFKYYRADMEGSYYNPSNIIIGTNFLFFLYGIVPVAVEKLVGRVGAMEWIWETIPRPLQTFLVLMTSLPLAFWFIDPYMHGRLLLDYEGLVLTIVKLE